MPGQTVAAHLDGVYFWGATRYQYPQWLLAAMAGSGLFSDRFVDQVQVVAYFHDWEAAATARGGEFIHYATGAPRAIAPLSRAGTAVDGSKVVHAADVYEGDASAPPLPLLDKDASHLLQYDESSADWALLSDGTEVQRYRSELLRASVVYRARCFVDEAEARRFNGKGGPKTLPLDTILRTLAGELVRRGLVSTVAAAMAMDRIALALLIIDTFIPYPLPERWLPYNYCALGRLHPWTAPLLRRVCAE